MGLTGVPLAEALAGVESPLREDIEAVSDALTGAGLRHVLAGGLAAHLLGAADAPEDVALLLGPQANDVEGGWPGFRGGLPATVGALPVRYVVCADGDAMLDPVASDEPHVATVELLAYVGLAFDDPEPIAAVIRADLDVRWVGTWLAARAPEHAEGWQRLLDQEFAVLPA